MLREKLHEYIDVAEERHLAAIFILVKEKMPGNEDVMTKRLWKC